MSYLPPAPMQRATVDEREARSLMERGFEVLDVTTIADVERRYIVVKPPAERRTRDRWACPACGAGDDGGAACSFCGTVRLT